MSALSKFSEMLIKEGLAKDHEASAPTSFLDTGFPPLNKNLSGNVNLGLPAGRVVMIAGPSGSGKTMIATQLMISAQKQGGYAAIFDHEFGYDSRIAVKQGLNIGLDYFTYTEGVSFEKSIVDALKLGRLIRETKHINEHAPIVFVFDSIAAMTPMHKLEKNVDAYTMNDSTMLARVTSQLFPIIVQKCRELNITAVFLNQTRDSLSQYTPATTPGGKSPYYYSSTVIYLSGTLQKDKDGRIAGRNVTAKVDKCRITAPGKTCEWDFLFDKDTGEGHFDVIGSYAKYLKNQGKIVSAGARVEWNGGKPYLSEVIKELMFLPDPVDYLKKIDLGIINPSIAP